MPDSRTQDFPPQHHLELQPPSHFLLRPKDSPGLLTSASPFSRLFFFSHFPKEWKREREREKKTRKHYASLIKIKYTYTASGPHKQCSQNLIFFSDVGENHCYMLGKAQMGENGTYCNQVVNRFPCLGNLLPFRIPCPTEA